MEGFRLVDSISLSHTRVTDKFVKPSGGKFFSAIV